MSNDVSQYAFNPFGSICAIRKVPLFRVVQANGKIFKEEYLPNGKPIIIIYFLPDCDHCQKLIKGLNKRMAEFNKASILMITYKPLNRVAKFINDYNLQKFSNLYIGTEGNSLFARNYYKVDQMPFIALYNKNGDVIRLYLKESL